FPEEINRRLVSVIADYHFAPTETARENLMSEGVPEERIYVTGNTVVDALWGALKLIQSGKINLNEELTKIIAEKPGSRIIPITIHRRESFGTPLENMCRALRELALRYPRDLFIYPVHLNPNVQKPVHSLLGGIDNLYLIKPLDYFSFIYLLDKAYLILTDSGGIQEEASSLGKPVLVLRDKTERPEGVQAGVLKMIGTEEKGIMLETATILDNPVQYGKMSIQEHPYGDGKAAERIAEIIVSEIFRI
ncbi:MAG: UDP-N-acetylglucosamine 2-epimerase (non-hydrolyzing), partial [Desulfobacteraceae bacterium]